jgi:5'-3' exonuclease
LVDGSSWMFRAFYGYPQTFKAPDGRLVNAVRGFLDRLAFLVDARKPRSLAIATDEDWRPAWRVEELPSYKSQRVAEPVPPLLIPQLPLIEAALDAIGLNVIGKPDYEAEDIIASLAAKVEPPIEIASGDRDLFALVRDPDVKVLYPEKAGLKVVDEAEIERRYGIPGRAYADFAILRGDPSDGLPGVPGIGEKTAAGLVRRYGSVEAMIPAMNWSPAVVDYLLRAKRVVTPVATLDLPDPRPGLPAAAADPERLEKMNRELGIGSASSRLLTALNQNA